MSSLSVGVDEFTLVLQAPDKVKVTDWPDVADKMLAMLLAKLRLVDLFGEMSSTAKVQAGYMTGLTYNDKPWYLMICWNEDFPTMGVCLRFSAYAYATYKEAFKERYGSNMNIAMLLNMIRQDDTYTIRLSRIDLTADYYDYPDELLPGRQLSPNLIYERIKRGDYVVKNGNGHQAIRNISGLDKGGTYQTFYLGSRKGKTNGFLRCYDKRAEQMETMGFRYEETFKCESWIRFEAVYRHDYAHIITENLLTVETVPELLKMIARYICDKYQFFDVNTNEVTEFTADLLAVAEGSNVPALRLESPRNNDLKKTIRHLCTGSGLFPALYKASEIWGNNADRQLMDYLYQKYEVYKQRLLDGQEPYKLRDISAWIQTHKSEIEKQSLASYLGCATVNAPLNNAPTGAHR